MKGKLEMANGKTETFEEFVMGACRLVLGDYAKALADVQGVNLIFTSPPYNIGSKCPKMTGRRNMRDAQGNLLGWCDAKSWQAVTEYPDSLPEDVYQEQQKEFLRWCLARLAPNGVIIYNHKPRHRKGELIKPEEWILPLKWRGELEFSQEIVWDRLSTHNHAKAFVYPQSERLFVLKRPGETPHFRNEPPLWDEEKKKKNKGVGDVWSIPPAPGESFHNAPFPELLARQCVRMWSRPGDLVMDPYSGSGTTMAACLWDNRRFVGAEEITKFFEKTVARIEKTVARIRGEEKESA